MIFSVFSDTPKSAKPRTNKCYIKIHYKIKSKPFLCTKRIDLYKIRQYLNLCISAFVVLTRADLKKFLKKVWKAILTEAVET